MSPSSASCRSCFWQEGASKTVKIGLYDTRCFSAPSAQRVASLEVQAQARAQDSWYVVVRTPEMRPAFNNLDGYLALVWICAPLNERANEQ